MRTLFLMSVFLTSISLIAQRQYNFSKRNTIGFTSNFFHIDNVTSLGYNEHFVSLQRVLTRRKSLIAEYSFAKYNSDFDGFGPPVLKLEVNDATTGKTEKYILRLANSTTIRTRSYHFGIRYYIRAKGAIAPYGYFTEFKTGLSKIYRLESDKNEIYKDIYGNIVNFPIPQYGMTSIDVLNFQMGWGVAKPIVRNLIFTAMLNTQLNIGLVKGAIKNDEVYYGDLYYFKNAQMLFNRNNSVKFNLGLHYAF